MSGGEKRPYGWVSSGGMVGSASRAKPMLMCCSVVTGFGFVCFRSFKLKTSSWEEQNCSRPVSAEGGVWDISGLLQLKVTQVLLGQC